MDSQIERLTYERILSSQNQLIVKEAEDAASRQAQLTPADIIKDPYVLDFLGLPSGVNFYEKDLEKALIDNLQQFLLELGRGFSFSSFPLFHVNTVSRPTTKTTMSILYSITSSSNALC